MPKTKEVALKSEVKETGLTAQTINTGTSLFFDVARFELAQRVAQVFASSTMIPAQFKDNIGNCIIAINLADRMKADPFMLMQNMYIVHGKPGIEAKLAIALVNNTGKFTALQYRYNADKTSCYAHAKHIRSGEEYKGVEISIKMAKDEGWFGKPGSKWKTMPELMLMYRSAMFFARAYCPEALLGMQSKEELHDVGDTSKNAKKQLEKDVKSHANKEVIDIEPEPEPAAKPDDDIPPNLEMSEEEKTAIEAEEAAQGEPDF